jgi:hypothetical protein
VRTGSFDNQGKERLERLFAGISGSAPLSAALRSNRGTDEPSFKWAL